ncbi:MAG TPA: type II secretion system F family protein [Phycisphaerae bacterium]|nr:type II secretion system F family protein [Phycisphaerae bacterium]HOJ76253.1 type II secretion system F family protein [Phycisphaerae bacterium]HOM53639.1 type II secretion system F family protein [Phycisphaerae bacterium]HON68068.1 type II secretion system F family protein [Phycisphaerae bacterium]HOQ86051.1 type II secretion system F family protein [Phycisphaerae bacterium]
MKSKQQSGTWLPVLLISTSVVVVLFSAVLNSVGAGLLADAFLSALIVTVTLALLVVGLYIAYRLSTVWVSRETTERIVISQIATVVRQHLPLATGLALAADSERGWTRVHLHRISRLLAQGLSLSEAVRSGFPDCSPVPFSLIRAGEQSGQLPAALEQAEEYLFERERQRSSDDVSVWVYLLIVGGFAAMVVSGIMIAVMPKYREIFKDYGVMLPRETIVLVGISEYVTDYPLVAMLPLLAIAMALYFNLRPRRIPNPTFSSRVADWIRWHTPAWGRVEFGRGMQVVLQAMRLGIRSGMGLERAARIAGQVDVNTQLSARVQQFADLIDRGTGIREAARRAELGEVTGVALAGGQRGNDLDAALRYAADYHGAIASRCWILLRNLAWPTWTLIMGVMVGFVVLALFLPLVTLINSVCM